ncbi:MAG: hypothetical protein KAT25_02485 [Sulfuriflexus sp.]|nr:hypothetical protein [Sulfuriflexus sp.]
MRQIHCDRQKLVVSLLIFISSFFVCQSAVVAAPTPVSTPEAIYAALDRWQIAWRELDKDGYISSYSPTFVGKQYADHSSWVTSREKRLTSQRWIKLKLSGIVIFVRNDGKYAANFTQQYQSDSFSETSRKQLLFAKYPKGWLIVSESEIKN